MERKVSIIIPCKNYNQHVGECINHCKELDYRNIEIILLSDTEITKSLKNVKVIVKKAKPSIKRNIASKKATGEILAFIDSDAYPDKNWLKNALKYLINDVGIVGGPNLTPKRDSFMQKVSGDILANRLMGSASIRYRITKPQEVNELPSCNFIIKKDSFLKLNGFDESLLTAEDTKLCFEIREKINKKILYVPDVIVYHHRRDSILGHLKQMFIYGRDVAYLSKKDRFRVYYILPSLFVLYLIIGLMFSFYSRGINIIYLTSIFIYILIVLIFSFKTNILRWSLISIGIILTHISYGIGFIKGTIR